MHHPVQGKSSSHLTRKRGWFCSQWQCSAISRQPDSFRYLASGRAKVHESPEQRCLESDSIKLMNAIERKEGDSTVHAGYNGLLFVHIYCGDITQYMVESRYWYIWSRYIRYLLYKQLYLRSIRQWRKCQSHVDKIVLRRNAPIHISSRSPTPITSLLPLLSSSSPPLSLTGLTFCCPLSLAIGFGGETQSGTSK